VLWIGPLRRAFLTWISEFLTGRLSMSVSHLRLKLALNPETSKKNKRCLSGPDVIVPEIVHETNIDTSRDVEEFPPQNGKATVVLVFGKKRPVGGENQAPIDYEEDTDSDTHATRQALSISYQESSGGSIRNGSGNGSRSGSRNGRRNGSSTS
jgi:hypothetical protein